MVIINFMEAMVKKHLIATKIKRKKRLKEIEM